MPSGKPKHRIYTMVFAQVSGAAARDTVQAMGGPGGFSADSIVTFVTLTKVR